MNAKPVIISLNDQSYTGQSGDNLLTSLLAQGADVHYGCRAGACGACRLYDVDTQSLVLACQTQIDSDRSLSTKPPLAYSRFSLLAKQFLTDSELACQLLGPSDESFGDRVIVSLKQEGRAQECMALNTPGQDLLLILSRCQWSDTDWQIITKLEPDDSLYLQQDKTIRKGRLLHELGVDQGKWLVVLSAQNQVYKAYWQQALASYSADIVAILALQNSKVERSVDLTEQAQWLASLREELSKTSSSELNILYHGQDISMQVWQEFFRSQRIRIQQLHFVR
ncbi:2Fe-2S iron-sulfur cluster binding domain-containing protein [Marinomonas sp. THO17]|uniref:2Fe-2S iron-sulfur cluster binding domain-containing protein n=1 Tax=Marinomonas sp. THO17 TaxID=3149048 RepID=UPI00336BF63F